jgi:hypothetical protein
MELRWAIRYRRTFVPEAIYLVQCMQLSPAVREQQRLKLQADIARPERELSAAQRDTPAPPPLPSAQQPS